MFGNLQKLIVLTAALFAISVSVPGQKRNEIKPPAETASLADTRSWIAEALVKYGSFKTRMETVTLSKVTFDGCGVTFTETRKSGSTSTATMGATRTTSVSKNDISIDLAKVRPDGISLEDHIYPELQSIKIWYAGFDLAEGSTAGRIYYVVVKTEAGEAIKSALLQMKRLCMAPN
jgi:hypothetical protein